MNVVVIQDKPSDSSPAARRKARAQVWLEAVDAGTPARMIAWLWDVSRQTVHLEVTKARTAEM